VHVGCQPAVAPGKAITFGMMRESRVRSILVYSADYRCRHCVAIGGDGWPDDLRQSDIEPRFVCRRASSLD